MGLPSTSFNKKFSANGIKQDNRCFWNTISVNIKDEFDSAQELSNFVEDCHYNQITSNKRKRAAKQNKLNENSTNGSEEHTGKLHFHTQNYVSVSD